jgi:hypothetical protein
MKFSMESLISNHSLEVETLALTLKLSAQKLLESLLLIMSILTLQQMRIVWE